MSTISVGADRNERLLGWAILLQLALVPLPAGGARPVVHAIFAVVMGLTALLWFARAGRTHLPGRPVLWSMLLLLAVLLLQVIPFGLLVGPFRFDVSQGLVESNTLSLSPGDTLLMLARQASYAFFFLLVLGAARSSAGRDVLLIGLVGIITGYALLALLARFLPAGTFAAWPLELFPVSTSATFINRNHFATYAGLGLVGALSIFAARWSGTGAARGLLHWRTVLTVAAAAILAAALVFTQSRGGLAAAGAGIVATFMLLAMRGRRRLRLVLAALVAGGTVAAALAYSAIDRFAVVATDPRVELFTQVLAMIATRPWLGFGGGSFEVAFQAFHRPPLSTDLVWNSAHSTYLELWSDLGIAAGSLPLLLGALLVWTAARGLSRTVGWAASLAALGSTAVVATHALVDFSLELPAVATTWLVLLALGVAAGLDNEPKPADR